MRAVTIAACPFLKRLGSTISASSAMLLAPHCPFMRYSGLSVADVLAHADAGSTSKVESDADQLENPFAGD